MAYTPIAEGTTDWDVPLNAALVDIDSRVTTNTTNIATNTADILAKVSKAGDTLSGTLTSTQTPVTNVAFAASVTGDSQARFAVRMDGDLEWGSGAATRDVTLTRASAAQLRVTPSANASASTSAGGALNVTNTGSTGAGIVAYTEQATPAGHLMVSRVNNATFNQSNIFAQYNGTGHNVNISHAGTGSASSGLNVGSTNPDHSAVGIGGVETAKGTIKVTHTGTGTDASASALSIDLAGTGTASQGIFMTGTNGGTTGNLLEIRNGGTGPVFRVTATGSTQLGSGTGSPDVTLARGAAGRLDLNSTDLRIGSVGRGLQIQEGTNAKMGTATLVGGTVTVANTSVTANSRIFLTSQADGGTPGFLRVSTRTPGTNFTITSGSGADTSTVAYLIIEP